MHDYKDLSLVAPTLQLRQTLAALDALVPADENRRERISAALCHLQFAIDLLDGARGADEQTAS